VRTKGIPNSPAKPVAVDQEAAVGPAATAREAFGDQPPTFSVPQAARYLGISRATAYRLAATGDLPVPVLRIGHSYRIPTAPLFELLRLPTADRDDVRQAAEPKAPMDYPEYQPPAGDRRIGTEPRYRATRIRVHNCRNGW